MTQAFRLPASGQPRTSSAHLPGLHADLRLVVARTATAFRALWGVGALATVALWATVASLPRWPFVMTTIAFVWIGALLWLLRSRKGLPAWAAVVDAAFFVLLMTAQAVLVPPDLIGDGSTWVWNGGCISILIACWLLRALDAIAVTLAISVAAYVGIGLAGRPPLTLGYAMTISILLLQTFAGLVSLRTMRAAVSRAEAALGRQDAAERAQAVDDNRKRLREELENRLHDDVKTALYAFGAGFLAGSPIQARTRAAEAIASIERLRTGARRDSRQSLAGALTQVADAARADGFGVVLNIDQRASGIGWSWLHRGRRRGEPREGWLPRAAIEAVADATAQALANARAYAGVAIATVDLVVRPGRFTVTIRDQGVGFDVTDESRFGRGIPNSIRGRMHEVGGDARVVSVRANDPSGQRGTTWTLTWDGGAVEASPMRIAHEAVAEYGHGFVLMFLVLSIFFHALSLYPVLFQQFDYRYWPAAAASWTVNLVAIVYLLGKVLRRSQVSINTARLMAVAIVTGAVGIAVNCQPWGILGFANWALSDSVWLLILVGIFSRVREAVAGAAVILATTCIMVMLNLAPDAPTVVKLIGIVVSTAVIQVGAAFAVRFMRRATEETSRAVWRASEIAAERLAAELASEHGKNLYLQLDDNIVMLLRQIAAGTKDVGDPAVQAECRKANNLLRQAAELRDRGAQDLIPLLSAADARGVTVTIAQLASLHAVPARLTALLLDCLEQVVMAAKPGRAILSIQDNVDASKIGATRPITATLQVPIEVGSGDEVRQRFRAPATLGDMAVGLDLYDSEGEPGDTSATLAMMKAVLYA